MKQRRSALGRPFSTEHSLRGADVVTQRDFPQRTRLFRRDAETSTRDACATKRGISLPGIQLDDQLLVDHRLHFLAGGDAGDFAAQRIAIGDEPIGDGSDLGEL